MNFTEIGIDIEELFKNFSRSEFIYDFLLCYDFPRSTIDRLKSGSKNKSKIDGELHLDSQLHFKSIESGSLNEAMAELKSRYPLIKSKKKPRFLLVTDFVNLSAFDTKTADSLDIELTALTKHFDFFLPLAGLEKAQAIGENPADVKAAEKMAKLYDAILKDNPSETKEQVHALNIFLTRLLFCFFAEDTGIFTDKIFVGSVKSHTQEDGSDLSGYIERIFTVLNQRDRADLPEYLSVFPYVNGGLFADHFPVPRFSRRSRNMIIECGDLCWAEINPDIFGSMIQAVITPEHRGGLGMHYTSVPNIMKVIKPLFLDELQEEFNSSKENVNKLKKLHNRLTRLKIFDPACGSGNFLIIAYKELRALEIKILKQLTVLTKTETLFLPQIHLTQFYGIELDDFAHEVAILSLWLAEHQMNLTFKEELAQIVPALPLRAGGNIVCGNACRLDWEEVCPKNEGEEIYILGNPPYLGFNMQNVEQKKDIAMVCPSPDNMKYLDYISCWFFKASNFIDSHSYFAFVTTNSICQGTQVPLVWAEIFKNGQEIYFAYPEFIWSNNAKHNAGVICSIVGVREKSNGKKYIFSNNIKFEVKNINAYLINGNNVIVERRQIPLSKISNISTGNVPYDGGHLILTEQEKNNLIYTDPNSNHFIKQLSGSYEFINGQDRYCIWIEDDNLNEALKIPDIKERIDLVRQSRIEGGKIARNYAHVPHRFYMTNRAKENQILIPRVSSVRRKYIPTGFLSSNVIVSDSAQVIYDPDLYIFSIINSNMHMTWVKVVAGRLKSDYRYSAVICYNTFPFPPITEAQKELLTLRVHAILEERERHSEKTLAELYDPDKMPAGLREAHRQNDLAIEQIYRPEPFTSDEERLEWLFKLYEDMIAAEKLRENGKTKKK